MRPKSSSRTPPKVEKPVEVSTSCVRIGGSPKGVGVASQTPGESAIWATIAPFWSSGGS